MPRPALIGLTILILLAIGLAVYFFLGRDPATFEEALIQTSLEMNKTLPLLVDKDTRLDATMAGPGRRFTYSYTLVNHAAADLDVSVLQNGMRPSLIANYKTLPQMESFRNGNVELHYQYRDRNGEFLTDIVVSPKDF